MANEHDSEAELTTADLQRYIKELSPASTPEERPIELVKNDMRSGKVFFYPASGFDWEPILDPKINSRFSTFIYCDWVMKLQDFEQGNHVAWQMQPVRNEALNFGCDSALEINICELGGIEVEIMDFLTPEEQAFYRRCYDDFANKQPWGRLLEVKIANRKVRLVFLCAEGVKTYLELFSAPHCAPEFLSIKGPGTGFGFNWTDFRRYKEALGRAVDRNPSKPTWLGADQEHDWPWISDDGQEGGMSVFTRPI